MNTVTHNQLFRQCLSSVPACQRAVFDRSFNMADKLDSILRERGLSYADFANLMHRSRKEIEKWMTGRYHFSKVAISQIEEALGCVLQ